MRCEVCEFRLQRGELVCPYCHTVDKGSLVWDEGTNVKKTKEFRRDVEEKESLFEMSTLLMYIYIIFFVVFYGGFLIYGKIANVDGHLIHVNYVVQGENFPNIIVYFLWPTFILLMIGFGYDTYIRPGRLSSVLNTLNLDKHDRILLMVITMIISIILGFIYVRGYTAHYETDIQMLFPEWMQGFHIRSMYYYITLGSCGFHLFWTVFDLNYIFERRTRIKEHREVTAMLKKREKKHY